MMAEMMGDDDFAHTEEEMKQQRSAVAKARRERIKVNQKYCWKNFWPIAVKISAAQPQMKFQNLGTDIG
jgi:hypothetical protein